MYAFGESFIKRYLLRCLQERASQFRHLMVSIIRTFMDGFMMEMVLDKDIGYLFSTRISNLTGAKQISYWIATIQVS